MRSARILKSLLRGATKRMSKNQDETSEKILKELKKLNRPKIVAQALETESK